MQRTLNLGILAHVDAGKTTLTERLLFAAGVIDEIGSVDDGSTQTDFLALERQRGITIKSAVVSFVIGDVTVNLIDTPGHPDFIAEVERVLNVLDGAVLVVSAVEGVQAQTRTLMRTLQRLRIPTVVFVNKIDRRGAQPELVLRSIAEKLTPAVVSMGSTLDVGTHAAGFTAYGGDDVAFAGRLANLLVDHDDALLAACVDDAAVVTYRRLRRALAAQTKHGWVHPVFFGSATTGAGIDSLMAGIVDLLPAATTRAGGPVSGTIFKVERGARGEKIAYVRMFTGTVRTRERLRFGENREGTVTAIRVFEGGSASGRSEVCGGEIGQLWGLGEIRIGDSIGDSIGRAGTASAQRRYFAPPTLETIVAPCRAADRGRLYVALAQLAEQDPLINLRRDDVRQELSVSLYGEVQKEVIEATLANDFGIDVEFEKSTTICVERPARTGAAFELITDDSNPFLATVGLRIEPAPVSAGIELRLEVEPGSLPLAFRRAIEQSVLETLHEGLYGWEVIDCVVTLTHSGYYARQSSAHGGFDASMSSTAGDFRHLTSLVLMSALTRAGTVVHEPIYRFHLEVPADTLAPLWAVLSRLRAVPEPPVVRGSSTTLDGQIPAARVHELRQQLPGRTRGEGVLECEFHGYRPIRGAIPIRARTDNDPLDRKAYLLHALRRT